jgi:hypothetical protein
MLDYTQTRRPASAPAVIAGIALACALVAICWAGWKIYNGSQPVRSSPPRSLTIAPRDAAAQYNLGRLDDQINESARAVQHDRRLLETVGAEHAPRAASVRVRMAQLSRTPE